MQGSIFRNRGEKEPLQASRGSKQEALLRRAGVAPHSGPIPHRDRRGMGHFPSRESQQLEVLERQKGKDALGRQEQKNRLPQTPPRKARRKGPQKSRTRIQG